MQDNQEENPGTSDDQTETLQDVSVSINCYCIICYIVVQFICEKNSDPNQIPQLLDATVVLQLNAVLRKCCNSAESNV